MAPRDYPEGEIKGRLLDIRRVVDAAIAHWEANVLPPLVEDLRNLQAEVDTLLAKTPRHWWD